jgi:hypothetical protein
LFELTAHDGTGRESAVAGHYRVQRMRFFQTRASA